MRFILLLILLVPLAHADTLSISDGGASFFLENDGDADFDFLGEDYAFEDSWYRQTGGTGQQFVTPDVTQLAGNSALATYTSADGMRLDVEYTLRDLGPIARLTFDATLTNGTGVTETGALVNYFDYDINGLSNAAQIIDNGGVNDVISVQATTSTLAANRLFRETTGIEIDNFSLLRQRIEAGTPLGRTDNGFVDEDFTGAASLDYTLAAGESLTFSGFTNAFDSAAVPEPSGLLGLCFAGMAGFGRRRKRTIA